MSRTRCEDASSLTYPAAALYSADPRHDRLNCPQTTSSSRSEWMR